MPSYVSHTIMAHDVYNRIDNKNVDLYYILTYSLGGDLCKYAKCRRDSHKIKTREFIYCICDYMKKNNLVDDKDARGFLYGHICHYVMDSTIHPLIWKLQKLCVSNPSNHTMIELYYDYYFTKKRYKIRLDKYDNKLIFKGKMNKKISDMVDYIYKEIYDCDNVSSYYKFNIGLYKKIRILYKTFGFNLVRKVSGINKFLKQNSKVDLLNNENNITYIDAFKKECNDSLDTLYEKSINWAIDYINEVNEYLKK